MLILQPLLPHAPVAHFANVQRRHICVCDADAELWDEEYESLQHLQEMAALAAQIAELKAIASTSSAALDSDVEADAGVRGACGVESELWDEVKWVGLTSQTSRALTHPHAPFPTTNCPHHYDHARELRDLRPESPSI